MKSLRGSQKHHRQFCTPLLLSLLLLSVFQPVVQSLVAPTTSMLPTQGEARFFLDTADVNEWERLLSTGIFHGITTNPTLLERANEPCTVDNLHRLADLALRKHRAQEFMGQAWGTTVEELYTCGMALSRKDPRRFVVKVPVTLIGTQAACRLIQSKVRVCLTAGYDASQAMIAAQLGAEYIAPYLGRIEDARGGGLSTCTQMQGIVQSMNSPTRILVASIRDVETLLTLTMTGLETATFSPAVADQLFGNAMTEQAAEDFQRAATGNGE